MKASGLTPKLLDMDNRLQWNANGDGKLKVSVDAGYDDNGKPLRAECGNPERRPGQTPSGM